ncbi:carboxylesterase/lipase family protein [Dickeya zeae]|uniref:carboxylesterase/lipase family protein n=1 Tax=Dickeya zeae TaxID=204042 RepID=UPI0020BDD26F|nr:carboxylesterase family protein [Dickeya zeae]
MKYLLGSALLVVSSFSFAGEPAPVVDTEAGKVQGYRTDEGISVYKGIPYAANPFTTERRFQAPQPMQPWQGIKKTVSDSPVPQPGRTPAQPLVGQAGDLTLNIWRPYDVKGKMPVMVWIPGGAWIREDATEPVYDGSVFAKKGVMVVTVNYRVGVDGFMHFAHRPDNRGIADQIAALKWVQRNITKFGGDPSRVTLFGQSAGAGSVAIHLGNPATKGLYQQAILQSPPMQWVSPADATRITQQFAHNLNISADPEAVAKVPFDVLVQNVLKVGDQIKDAAQWGRLSLGGTAFLPVADNKIIVRSPMEDLANNDSNRVPVIVGSTDSESRLYLVPNGGLQKITDKDVSTVIHDLRLPSGALQSYTKNSINAESAGDIYAQIMSDYTFRMPALNIANIMSGNQKTWFYNFSWRSPAYNGRLGAAHFVDVPFTFGTIQTKEAENFVGVNPPVSLSESINNAWVSFAKYGNPGWPHYSDKDKKIMMFNTKSGVATSLDPQITSLWEKFRY